ncbi:MAG: hypothetical protein U0990_04170, partial [Candidatus Nanopelagicales bacterium]|nr:hypothetical protein [Candidatus Nanopelagicales bacterium]
MKRIVVVAIIAGIVGALIGWVAPASADHGLVKCGTTGMQSCIITSSPLVDQYVKQGAELTYCVNARGLLYPGFRSQTTVNMAEWGRVLKTGAREVPYPTSQGSTSCLVRNDMRDDHPCGGCGAWVFITNLPVTVEYNARTGYVRWDSTIGHELGHAFCLLDEHYDQANFRSFILTYGYWIHGEPTVMDSGTFLLPAYAPLGISGPTEYDIGRCEETLGRSLTEDPPPPSCEGPVEPSGLYWDNCIARWINPAGWSFDPALNIWYTPGGAAEWLGCAGESLRWNLHVSAWFNVGHGFFDPNGGIWSFAPAC